MDSTINEVFSDFKSSLKSIDFAFYNPNSVEFTSALNVGLMWYLLHEMNGKDVPETINETKTAEKSEIADELFGAKKYYQRYLDMNDAVFKDMAKDELKHAEILIKKANSKLPSGDEKMKLREYEIELKAISDKVNEE